MVYSYLDKKIEVSLEKLIPIFLYLAKWDMLKIYNLLIDIKIKLKVNILVVWKVLVFSKKNFNFIYILSFLLFLALFF